MESPSTSSQQLFQEYLEVCNRALEVNRDRFPYQHLWQAAQEMVRNETISVAIYDDRPQAAYQLRFKGQCIEARQSERAAQKQPWRLNMSYLQQVVEHPEDYIQNPAKIDWDWLKAFKEPAE